MRDVQLQPGEMITRSVRKHWFVLLATLVPFALLAYLPTLFLPFLHFIMSIVPHSGQVATFSIPANPLIRLFYGLWLLMLWSAAFSTVTRYYLNQWIITNTRIIEIQQYGYFSREVSSVLLVRVQDVSSDVEGLFETIFGYGRLTVQSAGEEEHFIMDAISDPQGLRDLIMKEIAELHADGLPANVAVAAAHTGI
ncbi:MAG: PH domain-containing protein [Bacillota bacterium]